MLVKQNFFVLERTDTYLFNLPHKHVSIYQNAENLYSRNIWKFKIWLVIFIFKNDKKKQCNTIGEYMYMISKKIYEYLLFK